MTEHSVILQKLSGTDRRSIGQSQTVVIEVLANPTLFEQVFDGMQAADPVLRMRSADAVEKISARRPDLLQPYKDQLLGPLAACGQQEIRWHVAQMLPRLDLEPEEITTAVEILRSFLKDQSSIVRTFALQGLADLINQDPTLKPEVISLIEESVIIGSPAEKSRGRRLHSTLQSITKSGK